MDNLDKSLSEFLEKLSNTTDVAKLVELKNYYLGKSGVVTAELKKMKDLSVEEKKAFGEKVNVVKTTIESSIERRREEIKNLEIERELESTPHVDLTIPSKESKGSLHPITIVEQKLIDIFRSMGFTVEDGNEIETEFNNFEAVNVPPLHPARDMQDTFYLDNGELLKTQTSAAQNKIMRKYGAPLKAIFPGRCFRNEELDASHENTFFQMEGMMIDEDISISNLIYFMKTMLSAVFERDVKVRLRPGFFPFVEPGFELDCSCPYCGGKGCNVCKGGGWIELCPCGMIHPNVLELGGIDTEKYQGFAFGLGLSRLAMMDFEINDIRKLNGGNLKDLTQVKVR